MAQLDWIDDGVGTWVDRDDGARLYVHSLGSASSAPALLIFDGIGCSGWAFRRLGPRLAEGQRVVLMHYRGHGKSPSPPRPWRLGMHTLADDAAAVCDALGIERVVALGFSMGFQVALEFYRRHRHRVLGLVSLAGPPGQPLASFQGTDSFSFALPFVVAATRVARQMTSRVWRSVLPSQPAIEFGLRYEVNAERIDSGDFELYLRQMADMNPELFVAMLEQAQRHTAEDLLPSIRVPTMVIAGARDSFVPVARLRTMAFAIPGARWEVIDEATHALPAEYPDELADQLLDFLSELSGPEPSRAGGAHEGARRASAKA
ncbi:2-hydroxy-6-oxononadienedioate/2-hydroxy-6-oxononatrienedioate hydrolase [Enhygromyxa salina]|uniref:2-hydroxy-6-oxononadienedioate/2-hydroxy-6-oxononatrienedioate hydrolase n=1 Tax=Enhygromyxa salina TaxID=215803 RepID=A0A2S9XLP9_9BACT|nr:alpha/beta hydrolase [Enhygromyxa salina]PRP93799.1 2-hydroxy-6-oxononadienedioate/2-hydroxy-6-oxononatrienedioate hydrolase [Enhygromyxa salina]